ncbi:superoxide dismutase [Actinocrispum sp. NPDC049592]|uniref:superoxide dismutase n=1 Tax=Actinocrispum sp. NPDC049592 TaxID=3154835 RepID=UPI00343C8988
MFLRSLTVAMTAAAAAAGPVHAAPSWNGELRVTTAAATMAPYSPGTGAVTYSPLVPAGSSLATVAISSKQTSVMLTVQGLLPKRQYGAHVHTKPCGPNPNDSGPHFQNVPDPVQPSVDPAYANPRNEIWLDFTTDRAGNALVFAHTLWGFGTRHAYSIVLHATHTHTDPGHAGTAGARLACLNAEF